MFRLKIFAFACITCVVTAGCGGGKSMTTLPRLPLSLKASVDAGNTVDVTAPHSLNLPNIGDSGVLTAYEGNQQVSFSLSPDAACMGVVDISPEANAMQQTVTASSSGQCNATVQASDGSTATLAIFSLPPP